jgi:hypothetical protein
MTAPQLPTFLRNDCGVDVLQIGDWYMARLGIWQDWSRVMEDLRASPI